MFLSWKKGHKHFPICSWSTPCGCTGHTHCIHPLTTQLNVSPPQSLQTNECKQGRVGVSVVLHHFSAAIITGLFSLSLRVPLRLRTGWLVELCMFICWFHYRSRCLSWNNGEFSSVIMVLIPPPCSLVGEMMSTLGSFSSVWMKSSDAAAYNWLQFSNLPNSHKGGVSDGFVVVLPIWIRPHFRVAALYFSVSYHCRASSHNVVPFRI